MSWRSKVVWTQGMFLQPHHFQQEARYVERLVDTRVRALSPHAWGYAELVLDEGLLALGRVGITRASGVLPDGTPFSIPQLDAAPPPLDVPADIKSEIVYLVAPLQREGVLEFAFANGSGGAAASRYQAADLAVRDNTGEQGEAVDIQTGQLNLRLLAARDATDAYARLGTVQVQERRSDQRLALERAYIAPQLSIDATAQLSSSVTLLHGLVRQRTHALAARMGQLSHGVSEMADFLMLLLLNRHEPLLRQLTLAPNIHPRQLFDHLLMLAGELSTLASAARRPGDHPPYRHEDLRATFEPLVESLREMLSAVLEQNAVAIELVERKHGVHTAVIGNLELVKNSTFVLAANAKMPGEQVRNTVLAKTRIAPVDRIVELVNGNLPGITLRNLPVAPRQLPFHAGFYYFELERGSELWQQLEKSGSLALHVAGEMPGLELELWAIRR